jgi:8-oxo-dGTP diphosphatase
MKQFLSLKAFIVQRNKVLILREAEKYEDGYNAGTYEIPGGRIDPGEHFKDGLLREIKEEVGLISVTVGKPFFVEEYRPVVKGEKWHVVAIYFNCSSDSDKVVLSEDHDSYEWIDPKDYEKYPFKSTAKKAFKEFITIEQLHMIEQEKTA